MEHQDPRLGIFILDRSRTFRPSSTPRMDYKPHHFRSLPPWAWRAFSLLLGLGILYQLGAWIWGQLSG